MTRAGRSLAVLAAAMGVLAALPARAGGDAEKGRRVAERVCARCHVVGESNRYGGIDSTPSFFTMAAKPQSYERRLAAFRSRPPHRGQKLKVTDAEVEDLIVYVRTLRRRAKD